MTTVAHALSASILAVTAAGVSTAETRYLVVAVVAAAIADLDHVYPVLRDWRHYRAHGFRGNLHGARTPLHEMVGLMLAGAVALACSFADPRLGAVVFIGYATHLMQDFVMGRSLPFQPFDHTEVQLFAASFRQKAAVDVCVITGSLALWALFLSGRL